MHEICQKFCIPSEDEFKCVDGICIPFNLRCDFSWDCMDGSDEGNCTEYPERCDFENGFCNWIHGTNAPYRWTWFSGRTLEEDTGPDRDHTYGNETGHYLYIPSSLSEQQFTARIASTKFLGTQPGICEIRLWYHMYGEHISNLSVLISPVGGMDKSLVTKSGSQGDEWKRLVVPLVSRLNFQVYIEGKRGLGRKGDIAIDDISFTPTCVPLYELSTTPIPSVQPPGKCQETEFTCEDNSCISLDKVCDFKEDCPLGADEETCASKCTFEADSLCGWNLNVELPDGIFWNISTSIKKDCLTEPPQKDITFNSTSGHYLLLCFTSAMAKWKDGLHMASPKFVKSASTCKISFWQFSAGSINTIGLKINSLDIESVIWQNSLQRRMQSGRWIWETIGIGQRREPFSLSFERLSNIVIQDVFVVDDIEFIDCAFPKMKKKEICPPNTHFTCRESGGCISRNLICDLSDDCGDGSDELGCNDNYMITFENGTGFFHQDETNKYKWTFGNGQYKDRLKLGTGPPCDHTYFTEKGNYIFLTSDFAPPEEAIRLVSDVFKVSSHGKCTLTFYFYMFGSSVNELNVYTRSSVNGSLVRTWRKTGQQGDFWQRASISFNQASPFKIIIEGKTNYHQDDVIAVDDMSVEGECNISPGTLPTTVNPDTTPTVPSGCKKGEWKCAVNGQCISNTRKCDFRTDCADGSDENGCVKPTCNFYGGDMCEWRIVPAQASPSKFEADIFTWIVTRANETKVTDRPLTDHSNNSEYGWYAIASGLTGKRFSSTSLQTPFVSRSHARCMFEFWYHCTMEECPLNIYSREEIMDGMKKNHLWGPQLSGEELEAQWRMGKAYVGFAEKFQIQMEAKKVGKRSIAIDDISFNKCEPPEMTDPETGFCKSNQYKCDNGDCISYSLVCDLQPDCEDGSDESSIACQSFYGICTFEKGICNTWTLESSTNRVWVLHSTGNVTTGSLPPHDHTQSRNGYYLTVENMLPKESNKGKARLASHVVHSTSAQNCTVRFWFYILGTGHSVNVYRRTTYNESGLNLLASYNDNRRIWEFAEVILNPDNDDNIFKAVLEAQVSEEVGSVSLDDLSMNQECHESKEDLPGKSRPPPPEPNDCGPEKFPCKNKNCFTRVQQCNFIDDCGDGTDEADCGTDCDFENDACGWYNPAGYRAQWTITTPESLALEKRGPTVDHTYGNKSGHFMYPGRGNFVRPSDMAQLHSRVYISSGPSCTLNFWYYMYTDAIDSNAELFVLVKTANRKEEVETVWKEVWSVTDKREKIWHEAAAEIRKRENFGIVIGATRGSGNNNDVSIDDIKFESCHPDSPVIKCTSDEWMCKDKSDCLKQWQLCDKSKDCHDSSDESGCAKHLGDCDFNSDNWLEECNWKVWPQNYFNWSRANESHTDKTGPPYDNSIDVEGYYLFINSSEGSQGDRATVATPEFPAGIGNCHLRFWYFMYGSGAMGELQVSSYGTGGHIIPLVNKKGSDEAKWKYIHVESGNSQNYRVVFDGEVGGDEFTDIAIDDVTFTEGCEKGGFIVQPTGTPSVCSDDQFPCKNGKPPCISLSWRCDCAPDCDDGSDEKGCGTCATTGAPKTLPPLTTPLTSSSSEASSVTSSMEPYTTPPPSTCPRGFFHCRDSSKKCIEGIRRCDGVPDCPDKSDENYLCPEVKCRENFYFCPDLKDKPCLRVAVICNGKDDCLDGSDESLCFLKTCPTDYCKGDSTCDLNKRGFPICSCGKKDLGVRCYEVEEQTKKGSHSSQAWIAGVVIGTIVFIAMVALIARYYVKKVQADDTRKGLRTIENPVYGMAFDDLKFGEIDTDVPAGESSGVSPTGIENPLYKKY